MQEVDEALLVSQKLRKYFIEKKRYVLKNPKYQIRKFDNDEYWLKTADMLVEHKISPELFLDTLFADVKMQPTIIGPHTLCGKFGRSLCKRIVAQRSAAGDDGEEAQYSTVKKHVDNYVKMLVELTGSTELEDLVEAARNPILNIPPVYRCFLFPEDPVVLRDYGEQAYLYLRENKSVVDVFKKMGMDTDTFMKIVGALYG
jgi:hypothetical protein